MKKKLIFLFTMLHLACSSQTEWAPIGAKWYVSVIESLMPLNEGYILYEVSRDTMMEDKKVKVITKTYFHSNGEEVSTLENEYTFEKDGIVYYWKNGSFYTLYNFNAKQGDKWTVYGSGRYREMCDYDSLGVVVVDSVSTVIVNNQSLKAIYTSPDSASDWHFEGVILERIGNITHLFPKSEGCVLDFPDDEGSLRCYEDSLIGIYKANFCELVNCACDELKNYDDDYTPLTLNAGNDLIVCPLAEENFVLGGNPSASGGVKPYTYTWSGKHFDLKYPTGIPSWIYASDILDDTTKSNPAITEWRSVPEEWTTYYLKVEDAEGTIMYDSVQVIRSLFLIGGPYKLPVTIHKGDSVQFFGNISLFSNFEPLTEFLFSPTHGLSDPTDIYGWTKPDTSITYYLEAVNSAGCRSGKIEYWHIEVIDTTIVSQNWADNNAVWHYNQINFDTPPHQGFIKFTAAGDTLIHGDTLKIILEENISINDTLSGKIYMKSDSNRVYYYIPEIKAYKLLYDFNANRGDTIEVYCRQAFNDSTIKVHVDSVSTIDVNGNSLKVQYVSQIHSETDEFWLEGEIIENIGWTGFMFPLHAWADPPYGGSLRCYQDDIIGNYKLTEVQCNYIANSQQNTYQNLVQEGKLWSNTTIPTMPGEYRSYWIKFEGDTLINDLNYKKVLRADDSLHSEWYLNGFIREDITNQKVYLYNSYSQEDMLLYDFSLETGDSILTFSGFRYAKVDTVLYKPFGNSTDSLKQICFFGSCSNRSWIEGIGSLSGIMEGLDILVGGTPKLVCYYENNNLIYHNPDFETCFPEGIPVSVSTFDNKKDILIYPNPARDKITLVLPPEHSIKEIRLYSLTGTCLYSNTNVGSNLYEIQTSRFSGGSYILKVSTEKEVVTKKIVLY